MFLTDVFIIERLQILEEENSDKPMRVRGVFQRAEEPNNNKRIYPKAVLEAQMSKLQPLIEGRRLCGELDHPSNDTVKLSNASHLITKLEMKGNEVLGEAEILNTPAGLTAKALIKGGVQIGISSRGMGTLRESSDGTKTVNEDFKLVTFDLVADPSTRGAHPTLSESKQYQEILKKTTGERVFIQQLEEEIQKVLRLDEGKKGRAFKRAAAARKRKQQRRKQAEQGKGGVAGLDPKHPSSEQDAQERSAALDKETDEYLERKKRKLAGSRGRMEKFMKILKGKKEILPRSKWQPGVKRRLGNVIFLSPLDVAAKLAKRASGAFAGGTAAAAKGAGVEGVKGAVAGGGVSTRFAEPRRTQIAPSRKKKKEEEEEESTTSIVPPPLAASREVELIGKRLTEKIRGI